MSTRDVAINGLALENAALRADRDALKAELEKVKGDIDYANDLVCIAALKAEIEGLKADKAVLLDVDVELARANEDIGHLIKEKDAFETMAAKALLRVAELESANEGLAKRVGEQAAKARRFESELEGVKEGRYHEEAILRDRIAALEQCLTAHGIALP